jgi:membrane dipeptidase
MADDPVLARAIALLERVPLVDGHNDLPYVIRADRTAKGDVAAWDPSRPHQEHDTDIPRLRQGRVGAQVWAAFQPTNTPHPARTTLELIDIIHELTRLYPDTFLPVRRAADVARARRKGLIGSIVAVEGGVGLENSLAPLRVWREAGVRLMTLCHNETLDWVDSATDAPRHGGLTAFGRAVVLELNRLGIMVDLAHVSPAVMEQVLDISRAPVVFSHSNARALCDHPRNVPDAVLDRVPGQGGIVMATFVPPFICKRTREWYRPISEPWGKVAVNAGDETAHVSRAGPMPATTLEQVCDHIAYIANRIGTAHVGIGSDFYGGRTPQGLEHVGRFPHLIAELMRRGWSDDALAALAGGNFLRVFRAVERIGERLRREESARVGHAADYDA